MVPSLAETDRLGRFRRNSKDYERLTESSVVMIQISMIQLMVHRLRTS